MTKTSRALTEVWEWKERIFEEHKDLSLAEWVARTKEQSTQLLEKRGIDRTDKARKPKKAVGA